MSRRRSEGSLNQHLKIKHPEIFQKLGNLLVNKYSAKDFSQVPDSDWSLLSYQNTYFYLIFIHIYLSIPINASCPCSVLLLATLASIPFSLGFSTPIRLPSGPSMGSPWSDSSDQTHIEGRPFLVYFLSKLQWNRMTQTQVNMLLTKINIFFTKVRGVPGIWFSSTTSPLLWLRVW